MDCHTPNFLPAVTFSVLKLKKKPAGKRFTSDTEIIVGANAYTIYLVATIKLVHTAVLNVMGSHATEQIHLFFLALSLYQLKNFSH